MTTILGFSGPGGLFAGAGREHPHVINLRHFERGFLGLDCWCNNGTVLMKLDNLRADAGRWGWTRSLLVRLMSRLQRHAGLHVYRVGVRPLVRQRPEPNLPGGITLRVVQP